ncbi:MAG: hypothetical protein ABJG68_15305 [Crocinitomicaceae bacterium]
MKTFIFSISVMVSLSIYGQNDTLNFTNSQGLKQGHWIITGNMKPEKGFCDTCKIEEGNYIDDRKNGEWIKYHQDGTIRMKGVYEDRKIQGPPFEIKN